MTGKIKTRKHYCLYEEIEEDDIANNDSEWNPNEAIQVPSNLECKNKLA